MYFNLHKVKVGQPQLSFPKGKEITKIEARKPHPRSLSRGEGGRGDGSEQSLTIVPSPGEREDMEIEASKSYHRSSSGGEAGCKKID